MNPMCVENGVEGDNSGPSPGDRKGLYPELPQYHRCPEAKMEAPEERGLVGS